MECIVQTTADSLHIQIAAICPCACNCKDGLNTVRLLLNSESYAISLCFVREFGEV